MRALVQYQQQPLRDADFSSQFLGMLQREGHALPALGAMPEHEADAADAPGAFSREASGGAPDSSGGWPAPDLGDVGSAFHGLNLRSAPSSVTIAEHRDAGGLPTPDFSALLQPPGQHALSNGGAARAPAAAPHAYAADAGAAHAAAPAQGYAGGQGGAGVPLDDFALDILSSASADLPMGDDSSFWDQLMQQPSAGGGAGPMFVPPAGQAAPDGGGGPASAHR